MKTLLLSPTLFCPNLVANKVHTTTGRKLHSQHITKCAGNLFIATSIL